MNQIFVSINGTLIPEPDAKIHVSDLSIQRGYGIFDFLKTVNGKAIFIDNYLDRFFNSITEMNLEVDFNRSVLKIYIDQLMQRNQINNSGIKIILTGGYAADGYTVEKPNLLIIQTPFTLNPNNFEAGCKLITFNHQRQLPGIKTIDYLQAIRLSKTIKEQGADDVLYHNNGHVCECPRANFFIVNRDQIITPKNNILKGITRLKILGFEIEGYDIIESDIHLSQLDGIQEAFICSSTKNILPVVEIDGRILSGGKAGKITNLLNEQLNNAIMQFIK